MNPPLPLPTSSSTSAHQIHPHLASARRTFDTEANGILRLASLLTEDFIRVVDVFCQVRGRIIVMGMGKSGHIGRKIASTLSSTGTPAFFVHPAEAGHGDLGMLTKHDALLAISNSGEVDELTSLLPHIRRLGIPIAAMTGQPESTLAKYAHFVLLTHVETEACPLNLAPTASTSAQLAMGDALAIACLENRGFGAQDFAASHPGGALGRKLLTRVSDIMRTGNRIPVIAANTCFLDMMALMSQSGLGLAITTNAQNQPIGIFTDGDLRRELAQGTNLLEMSPAQLMKTPPKTIWDQSLAVQAASIMEEQKITALIAVNQNGELTGVFNTNDLLRAKVI